VWTVAVSGTKKLRIRKYPDTCGRGLKRELLSKPQRQRQRKRRQTKDLMSKTIAVHVRYKSLYISLLSSAKQQREMTKFWVF